MAKKAKKNQVPIEVLKKRLKKLAAIILKRSK
jgi:hypothetical protein